MLRMPWGQGIKIIGNCKYSKNYVFSFHAVKMITTGEGGFINK